MKTLDRNWRVLICRQILQNGKRFALGLATMDDDTALKYFKAYYPTEYNEVLGK